MGVSGGFRPRGKGPSCLKLAGAAVRGTRSHRELGGGGEGAKKGPGQAKTTSQPSLALL